MVRSILFLVFPNVGEQDLIAPWELMRSVAWNLHERGETLDVSLGSFEKGVVSTQMGTVIQPARMLSSADRFDMVYVPGGIGAGALSANEAVLAWLRANHDEGRWVAANCAGMGVLHRAGVLKDAPVTAPATLARRLAAQGAHVVSPRRAWKIVPARRIFSVAGAGTVHPSTIALAWHLFGDDVGRGLASGWDALPLFGESLFSLDGPVMHDDEHVKRSLQDAWEDVFLPATTLV